MFLIFDEHELFFLECIRTLFPHLKVSQKTLVKRQEGKVKIKTLFLKKETLAQVFSCKFCEISKNIFYHRAPVVTPKTFRCTVHGFFLLIRVFRLHFSHKMFFHKICSIT